ncbi:MAG: phosphotransferase [Caldilineaceae bacterium]
MPPTVDVLGSDPASVHGYGAQSAVGGRAQRVLSPDVVGDGTRFHQRIDASTATEDFDDPITADFVAVDAPARKRSSASAPAQPRSDASPQRNLPHVLCHTDIHTANVLVDPGGDLHIVDWDQPLFAPKERDLMFFVQNGPGEPVEPSVRHFFHGYGDTVIDWTALAYYRYEVGGAGVRRLRRTYPRRGWRRCHPLRGSARVSSTLRSRGCGGWGDQADGWM